MKKQFIKYGVAIVLLGSFIALGIRTVTQTNNQIRLKDIRLRDKSAELKELQLKYEKLNTNLDYELQQKNINQDKAKQLEQERNDLKQKLDQTQRELQAKLEAKRIAAERPQQAIGAVLGIQTASASPLGQKEAWMAAAGIPQSEWASVDYIVSRESGWKVCSFYPSQNDCNASPSTACGLVMQNPCGKIPGDWRDPVAALVWQKSYIASRYGSYSQAVVHWQANKSY